jgi:uncharacterized protein (TIGR00255 family)
MTGFARQTAESALGTMIWELRSVNHRYLEVAFRLPEELRPGEQRLRQQVGAAVKRGKVDCSFHFQRAIDRRQAMQIDTDLVDLIGARLGEIAARIPGAGAVNPVDIMRWPGVVGEPEIETESLFDEASELLGKALDELASMRSGEGARIAAMLESRCDEVVALAASVRERMPAVLDAARTKQRERIAKLDVEADPNRLEVELALIAQKLDVAEEVDRLDSHVTEIREALASGEPVGRRLDFLMQELNREANTLGSKSADAETTRAAVELKVLIEQMREQIQNVE